MSFLTYPVPYTYEDYLLFPNDGRRHELINGKHLVSPSLLTKHQRISRNLLVSICNFLRKNKIGEVFSAPCDIIFSDTNIVQPDLLFVSAEQASIVTEKMCKEPPTSLSKSFLLPSVRRMRSQNGSCTSGMA